jgi:hypothetical protein
MGSEMTATASRHPAVALAQSSAPTPTIRENLGRPRVTRARQLAAASTVLLTITALLPLVRRDGGEISMATDGASGFMIAAGCLGLAWRHAPVWAAGTLRRLRRALWELALYMSPVLLLSTIFPLASRRIADAHAGGTPLVTLLLASSVTVPWLSQAVCLPLYRAIGSLILDGDLDKIQTRLCQVWPTTFVQSLPAVAVFVLPVQFIMRWPWSALGTYIALCVLHVAFTQSLVASNVGRRRVRWALAWLCYAAALLLFPTLWWLPPAAGLISQLVPMRRYLRHSWPLVFLRTPAVGADLLRGLLLGAVLWSDKLFLFVKSGGTFQVETVFFALLPAVLAYNYYFVRLAPSIDRAVMTVRTAMAKRTTRVLAQQSRTASEVIMSSITATAFLGALIALAIGVVVGLRAPANLSYAVAVSIASLLFMMTTLVCYKLDYIGYHNPALGFSAAHLLLCGLAFAMFPIGTPLYLWLIGIEAGLFFAALYVCLDHWRCAEYALFWRHATAW